MPMNKKIVVGRTKKRATITICVNCDMFNIPHFNYIYKNGRAISLNMLHPRAVDDCANMELEDRTDLEEFLNKIVSKNEILENKKITNKLNKNNSKQTPKYLLKPYYRNFEEYIDTATFGNENDLEGAKIYTKMDQERTPHFIYRATTGEEIAILFEKVEYLYPIPRKLTSKELNILVKFLTGCIDKDYIRKIGLKNNWQNGIWTWNDQNYDGNRWNPNWFPKYLKLDENMQMPDYSKLND